MIYRVRIVVPAVNEEVTLAAESTEEAKRLATASALARMADKAIVTVTEMPPAPD